MSRIDHQDVHQYLSAQKLQRGIDGQADREQLRNNRRHHCNPQQQPSLHQKYPNQIDRMVDYFVEMITVAHKFDDALNSIAAHGHSRASNTLNL